MAQNVTNIRDLTPLRLGLSVFKQKVGVDSEASSGGFFFLFLRTVYSCLRNFKKFQRLGSVFYL